MNNFYCFLVFVLLVTACSESDSEHGLAQFSKIEKSLSAVDFVNSITENDTLNYYTFPYLYMGGGVSIGDINNDGLSDVFFTGNMSSNRLYLNKGDFSFEDITESAGAAGDQRWYTGATMVDINNDGWLDIYLSVSGIYETTANQLLINNKDNTFTERAKEYGLADNSTSIQATFFDYDKDGFLDVFVANYPQVKVSMGNSYYQQLMELNSPDLSGHLYHNEQNNTFRDVTTESGVQNFGMTLGITSSDFNNDGWIDLYLSNDFNVPDYLYINNGDGTFREVLKESTQHTAMFGMGTDAADFNNDGLIDFIQLDMTPSDHKRSKTNMASMSPASFYEGVKMGFHYQYMQNAVQLNNGVNESGVPVFSDVSRMTNMATTDWSWGVVFADMDNDGLKDAFITNGVLRDVNNNDAHQRFRNASFFGSVKDYKQLPSTPVSNYAFKNTGNLKFSEITTTWGLDEKGFANGVAYGDLDNDGNLDLVVNNVNAPASIFKNDNPSGNSYLSIELKGPHNNLQGIGAKVSITSNGVTQYLEQFLSRGFQSSVDPKLHFGLGASTIIEELKVVWPDGATQTMRDVKANQTLLIEHQNSTPGSYLSDAPVAKFSKNENAKIGYSHVEDYYNDFINEPLLPHRNSNIGPCVSVGDVDNDGMTDVFIGNAKGATARLYKQIEPGQFAVKPGPWEMDSLFEDTGSVLQDLDGDGDLDLFVLSGGNDPNANPQIYQDRLYINENNQFFTSKVLPKINTSSKCVLPLDFDQDGDLDLFIGGRITPGKYPFAPRSIILENIGGKDKELRYSVLGQDKMGGLINVGLVTSAIWVDIDGDDKYELVVTGEWMGVEIYKFKNDRFVELTENFALDELVGWWYSLAAADIDNDGDLDLIAGNLGLNYKYKTSKNNPFSIYVSDFDENGTTDIVLSYEKGEKKLPLRGRECSSEQVPAIAVRFETFDAFADASLEDIYGEYMLENALHYQANTFEHHWFENDNGRFIPHSLPRLSQISSINTIEQIDFNGDEFPDFIVAGNLYQSEVETPRNDASVGLVLEGTGNGFRTVPSQESGLKVIGEVRAIKEVKTDEKDNLFLFVKNDDPVALWNFKK